MGSYSRMYPERIVCLTEETTETLYLLGEGHRVVGISGYTLRPPEARSKPRVSSFISARYPKIEALEPDLILTFSDLQADIAAELVRAGLAGLLLQSALELRKSLQMIRVLAGLIGCEARGQALAADLECGLDDIRRPANAFTSRPRTFFEEWDSPLISGIQWVEELVEIAGGEPIFPELRGKRLAKDRIVQKDEVLKRKPDVILASWCGKKMKKSVDHVESGMGRHPRGSTRSDLRDSLNLYSSARPGGSDRRSAAYSRRLALSASGAHSTTTLDGIKRFS